MKSETCDSQTRRIPAPGANNTMDRLLAWKSVKRRESSMSENFGATSVQFKGRLHRAFPCKRYQQRHLLVCIPLLEGRRSIQLSYGRAT